MSLIRFKNSALPSLVDNFFTQDSPEFFPPFQSNSLPAVNILEQEDGFQIEMAAPGLIKEKFQINLNQNNLVISYNHEEKVEEHSGKYTRKEFRLNSFKRSFVLPQTIDNEQISASYADGVLKLWLPKKEEAKPRPERVIEIH